MYVGHSMSQTLSLVEVGGDGDAYTARRPAAACPYATKSDEERCAQRQHLPEPLSPKYGWGSTGLPQLGLDVHHHMVYGRTRHQREASSVPQPCCGHKGDECATCTGQHTEGLLRAPRQAARRRWHVWARQTGHGLGLLTRRAMAHRLTERCVSKGSPTRWHEVSSTVYSLAALYLSRPSSRSISMA